MLHHWITWLRTVFREWWQFGSSSSGALRTASLLDQAVAVNAAARVYRVTLNPDKSRRIQKIRREIGDGPELWEALSFLDEPAALDGSSLSDLLRVPFTR